MVNSFKKRNILFYISDNGTAERKFYASGLLEQCSQTEFPLCVYVVSWLICHRRNAAATASNVASIEFSVASSYAQNIFPTAGIRLNRVRVRPLNQTLRRNVIRAIGTRNV